MHRSISIAVVIVSSALSACQPLPQDASRTYPPGRTSDVAHGLGSTGMASGDGFRAPRVLPVSDLPTASVPVLEPAEVIHIWFFPVVSQDGAAFREGVWCHRVIRTFAWGAARVMEEASTALLGVPIPGDEDQRGDGAGADASGRVEPQDAFLDSLRDLGHEAAPYAPVPTLDPTQAPSRQAAAPSTSTPAIGH